MPISRSTGGVPGRTASRKWGACGSTVTAPLGSASPSGIPLHQRRRESGRALAVVRISGSLRLTAERQQVATASSREAARIIQLHCNDQDGDPLLAFRTAHRQGNSNGADPRSSARQLPDYPETDRRSGYSAAEGPASTTGAEAPASNRARPIRRMRGKAHPVTSQELSRRAGIESEAASCLRSDPKQLIGWEVVLADGGRRSGRVTSVLGLASGSATLLKVFGPGWGHTHNFGGRMQDSNATHLIPFAKGIVQGLDIEGQQIFITPPEGLLELSQRRMLLKWLDPQLEELAARLSQTDSNHRPGQRHKMPTKKQLVQCGRRDLVPAIQAAGGFLEVAHELNFRHRRKPAGYWDNLDTLDQEISRFIAANWVELSDADTESVYFYNQITGRVTESEPHLPTMEVCEHDGLYWTINEDVEDRVMPSVTEVCSAGRYDLHHGILYNGGYRKVARELHRPPSYPRFKPQTLMELAQELEDIMEEEGLGNRAPTPTLLYDIGKQHLLQVIHGFGGYPAVVEKLQRRGLSIYTRRRAKHWDDIDVAAKEIKEHMLKSSVDGELPGVLPTHRQLINDGRCDLRYALQKHGHSQVAKLIGVGVNRRGRRPAQRARSSPSP